MRESNRLSAIAIQRLKTPGRYGDGAGLWLQVSQSGGKAWLLRYMLNGKARHRGLGPVADVSLAEARELARKYRKTRLAGSDPIEARLRSAGAPWLRPLRA